MLWTLLQQDCRVAGKKIGIRDLASKNTVYISDRWDRTGHRLTKM